MIEIKQTTLNKEIAAQLIELSRKWHEEDITYGYRINQIDDLEDKEIFIVVEDEDIIKTIQT